MWRDFRARLNTIHNLRYYQRLMAEIRQAIEEDRFDDFVVEFYARIGKEVPPLQSGSKRTEITRSVYATT